MGLPESSGGAFVRVCARMSSVILSALALVLALALSPKISAAEDVENAFDSIIRRSSDAYSIDPLLVKAVIWNESRFKPLSTGASGEIGLMQLKWGAIRDWAEANGKPVPSRESVYDPYLNIEIGTWFLSRALQRWDGHRQSYALALCEYNAGRSRALLWQSRTGRDCDLVIESLKTRRYVANICDKYIEYSANTAASLAENLPVDIGNRQSLRAVRQ